MILGSWLRRYPFSAAFFHWVILKTDRDSCDLYEFGTFLEVMPTLLD
jgi:hypothetical protein